ncbi:SMAD/FHA domain-containing protein [Russula earlei]|uniref:SMAD/FHA domain-containing protein n=1 Tax=Russula earlei TaxID=71964 RepID=A0ACC0UK56_9AGAM|nr:SMAD/FHA domain-containing protein [Russula earlei]
MDGVFPHLVNSDSPPSRQNILTSFLRGRPRGTSQSQHPSPVLDRDSPPPPFPPPHLFASPPSPGPTPNRRRSTAPQALQPSVSHTLPISSGITQILRRRRSGGALASIITPQVPAVVANTTPQPSSMPALSNVPPPPISTGAPHRIRLVPHLDSRRSLRFDPIARDVVEGDSALRIGRFTERSGMGVSQANALNSNKLAFKSKVVSRAHAEIWCESGGKFFIKDTKSSSGTFLNHVRLSPANQDSRPFELKDGDTLQLGVDYQGGTEDIYKCVRIRVEIGREWQACANVFKCVTFSGLAAIDCLSGGVFRFSTTALRQLRSLAALNAPTAPKPTDKKPVPKSGFSDCCICLFSVTIRQALFIAPCSHAFHYKCIRPLLETHHPAFLCPLCRTFANLEEDVEIDVASIDLEDEAAEEALVPVAAPEEAEIMMLSPNIARERDGAETEVEPEAGISGNLRRIPVPPSIIDLAEESDDDRDAEMADASHHDDEPPLPPLPEGENLLPPPPPEREIPGARSASVSDAEDASGESAHEVDEADRAAKRKR